MLEKVRGLSLRPILIGFAVLVFALFENDPSNKLLYYPSIHAVLEIFCVFIAIMIFVIQTLFKSGQRSSPFSIIAWPFLTIAILDLLHLLSYKGMPDFFTYNSAQKSVTLWLSARFLESCTTFLFTLVTAGLVNFKLTSKRWKLGLSSYLVLIVILAFWYIDEIPVFADATGQVNEKKMALESLFIAAHLGTIYIYLKFGNAAMKRFVDLANSSVFMIMCGICFIFYTSTTDHLNLVGHLFKIIAYGYIFKLCLADEIIQSLLEFFKLDRKFESIEKGYSDAKFQLLQAERLSALGQSTARIVHDMNNMLTIVELAAKSIKGSNSNSQPSQELEKNIERVLLATEKSKNLNRSLLNKMKLNEVKESKEFDIRSRLLELHTLFTSILPPRTKLQLDIQENLLITAVPEFFDQLFLNLAMNAKDALLEISEPEFSVVGKKVGDKIVLSISDNGAGIAPELLNQIFDSFFTTKSENLGTGLGLTTVKDIVNSLGGQIQVKSELGKGTTFEISI